MTKEEVLAAINEGLSEYSLEELVHVLEVLSMSEEDIAKEDAATAYLNSLPDDLVSN